MIDRHGEGSAIGSELLGSSDRLFHRWHKYRDGEIAWSPFLGYARPIRSGVRQAPGRGASCAGEKPAATCRMLLENEGHLWTFLRVQGIEPTNNAAERALRHAVLWRKSSDGTASEWGSRFVAGPERGGELPPAGAKRAGVPDRLLPCSFGGSTSPSLVEVASPTLAS